MNWGTLAAALAIVAVFIWLKQSGQIGRGAAAAFLKQGAQVIDVRTPGEFLSKHLPGAINLPLGGSDEEVLKRVPDRDKVLLLHCHSGTRSALAKRQYKRLGYRRVFNLGSYRRAESIVGESRT